MALFMFVGGTTSSITRSAFSVRGQATEIADKHVTMVLV
jgi:hypothetical protein